MRAVAVGVFLVAVIGAACGGDNAASTSTSVEPPASTTATTSSTDSTTTEPVAETASTTTQPPTTTTEGAATNAAFPSVDELESAGDCDALNELMPGVEAEVFRFQADVTWDEYNTAAGADQLSELIPFDAHYTAFWDTNAALNCSTAEAETILAAARVERCEVWLADGHDLDEDPLLVNTLVCVDAVASA